MERRNSLASFERYWIREMITSGSSTLGRVSLRPLTHSDIPALLNYRNDPEVARYQSWVTFSEGEAISLVEERRPIGATPPGDWGQLGIELSDTHVLIGDCGLKIYPDDSSQAEIGFTVSRSFHGRGYATEAVSLLLDLAFDQLGVRRVTAVTDCENASCVKLLGRIGMRREGHFIQNLWFKGKWGDEYLYAILRHEWARERMRQRFVSVGPDHEQS